MTKGLLTTKSAARLSSDIVAKALFCSCFVISPFEREMRPFEIIKDYNKRTLLTMDVEPEIAYKGIQKINIINWLLDN